MNKGKRNISFPTQAAEQETKMTEPRETQFLDATQFCRAHGMLLVIFGSTAGLQSKPNQLWKEVQIVELNMTHKEIFCVQDSSVW